MSESVEECSFEGPFFINDFYSLIGFNVIAKCSLKPAYSRLQVKALAIPFVVLHDSFEDIAIFEDNYGFSRALTLQKLANIDLMRT